jgi:hypothetical protein
LQGAGVNLDAGKLTVKAERFFGVASVMALNTMSKLASWLMVFRAITLATPTNS